MRIVFMGTPDFAVPALKALIDAGHESRRRLYPAAAPGGTRASASSPRPSTSWRERRGIAGAHAGQRCASAATQRDFAALEPDAAVVAAYGLILPKPMLDAPRLGCLNIHASLLPRWRGAAPIQRAILAGDAETGVTIMQMDEGLDTGPMLLQARRRDRRRRRRRRAARRAGGARRATDRRGAGAAGARTAPATPQPGDGVTYAPKIDAATRAASTGASRPPSSTARSAPSIAVARRLVRARGRARSRCWTADGRRGQRRAGHGARRRPRRSPAARARCGRPRCSAPASAAMRRRGVPARLSRSPRGTVAAVMPRYKLHARI